MSFEVTADAYARYIGRFSEPLASRFADLLQLRQGRRALDVGCGSGALTAVLVGHLGAGAVTAVDPSESFVAAVRTRLPGLTSAAARQSTCRSRMPPSTSQPPSSSCIS